MSSQLQQGKSAGKGLLIAGYFFSLLGGILGIVIGASIWLGKIRIEGVKQRKYNKASRRHGLIIFVLGLVMMLLMGLISTNRDINREFFSFFRGITSLVL